MLKKTEEWEKIESDQMEALEGFSRNGESAREDFKLLVSEQRDRRRLWRLSGHLEEVTGPPVTASVRRT